MPREYRYIKLYEKEILEMESQEATKREIGEKFSFTYEKAHSFIARYKRFTTFCNSILSLTFKS